ncbi:MAG: 4Fe-4S binding protein [Deltaproteobacteria bacterium]|nr:4Fe-4S binding protein [Deltaproteobacteria bacterium]
MEKYELYVRQAKTTLTYPPGWSRDNLTGGWRTERPVLDAGKCNGCQLCWLFCPDGVIDRATFQPNLSYCKGCGICATECRRGALRMERETP